MRSEAVENNKYQTQGDFRSEVIPCEAQGNLAVACPADRREGFIPVQGGLSQVIQAKENQSPANGIWKYAVADNTPRMGPASGYQGDRPLYADWSNSQKAGLFADQILRNYRQYGHSGHLHPNKFAETILKIPYLSKAQKADYIRQLAEVKWGRHPKFSIEKLWKKASGDPDLARAILAGFHSAEPNPNKNLASVFGRYAPAAILPDIAMRIRQNFSSVGAHVMRNFLQGIKGSARMNHVFRKITGSTRKLFVEAVASSASLPERLAKEMKTSHLTEVVRGISKLPPPGGDLETPGDVLQRMFEKMPRHKKNAVLRKLCLDSQGGIKEVLATQRDQDPALFGKTFLFRGLDVRCASLIRNTFVRLAKQAYKQPNVQNEAHMGLVLSRVKAYMRSRGVSVLHEGGITINLKQIVQLQAKLSRTVQNVVQDSSSSGTTLSGTVLQQYLRDVRNFRSTVRFDDLAVQVQNWAIGQGSGYERAFNRRATEVRLYR